MVLLLLRLGFLDGFSTMLVGIVITKEESEEKRKKKRKKAKGEKRRDYSPSPPVAQILLRGYFGQRNASGHRNDIE